MLVAEDPDTGNEVWRAVHINKMPTKDKFKLKPSYYNSPNKDNQPNVVEAKEINKDHLFNGLPRDKWWIQTALAIYKHKYRDYLSEELVREQNDLNSKRAKPARITKPQFKSIKSTKSIKHSEGKTVNEQQPNVKTIDLQGTFFAFEKNLSAGEYKLIGAEMANTLSLRTTPPTRVLSEMRDFARLTGYSVCYAPSWGQWLEDTRQELPEPAAVDAKATNKEEDEAREPMDLVSIADSIADIPSGFRLRLLDPMPDDMIAGIEKVTAYFEMRAKELAAGA